MSSHIVEKRVYYRIFFALMVLLVLTVLASYIQHPVLGIVAAITIAVVKAVLILLYFMHVRYSSPLLQIFAAAGFLWLLLLFAFVASDYITRASIL